MTEMMGCQLLYGENIQGVTWLQEGSVAHSFEMRFRAKIIFDLDLEGKLE